MAGQDRIWIGTQASRRKAICRVMVDGVDVTARLDPHLISVVVVDKEGEGTDTCAIELDDRDGRLAIPPDDVMLEVWLGWHTEVPAQSCRQPSQGGAGGGECQHAGELASHVELACEPR